MEEAVKYFQRLGLTQYESAALAALLSHHDADAQAISENASIPYTKIYAVLNSLEKQGFLKTTLERPKKYRPVSPDSIIETLLSRKQKEIDYLKERTEDNLGMINKLYNKGQHFEQEGPVIFNPSKEAVWDTVFDYFSTSKKIYTIVNKQVWNDFFFQREKVAKESIKFFKKGGTGRFILPSNVSVNFSKLNLTHLKATTHPSLKLKITTPDRIFYNVMIKDKKELGMSFHHPYNGEITSGVVIKDSNVVKGILDYFNIIWDTSESASSFFVNKAKKELNMRLDL